MRADRPIASPLRRLDPVQTGKLQKTCTFTAKNFISAGNQRLPLCGACKGKFGNDVVLSGWTDRLRAGVQFEVLTGGDDKLPRPGELRSRS